MKLVHASSLALTIDAIDEAFFWKTPLSRAQRKQAAHWIAGLRGKPGSYAGMFAPTSKDFKQGLTLFTGERITSRAAIGHILGEEACRALILLDSKSAEARTALKKATKGMLRSLTNSIVSKRGFYCCGTCTAALWRHLACGGLNHSRQRLVNGLKILKKLRAGNGEWRRFPFYYTLLALSEIDLPQAVAEMKYARDACEQKLKHLRDNGRRTQRRRALLERILAQCS